VETALAVIFSIAVALLLTYCVDKKWGGNDEGNEG
jgi:hypothetical protein